LISDCLGNRPTTLAFGLNPQYCSALLLHAPNKS
jgi:hypothetical protein